MVIAKTHDVAFSTSTQSSLDSRKAIKAHEHAWRDGYYEGDPLAPFGRSGYAQMNFVSMLHTVYQTCVRPYIQTNSNVIEIGCGRGAWTKTMLDAKTIYCLDAQSAEDNQFWSYVGPQHQNKIKYLKVSDFECRELPDDYFDFLFSFGTFCHIPWECQQLYYANLFSKMRPGAHGIIMFADYDKYDAAVSACARYGVNVKRPEENFITYYLKTIAATIRNLGAGVIMPCRAWSRLRKINRDHPGMWYSPGIDTVANYLRSIGWEVITPDIGICLRDPIIHFRRPKP